jgi:hypothetical protein
VQHQQSKPGCQATPSARAATSEHVASVNSDIGGRYVANLDPGTYYVSTDNSRGWINLIWGNVKCHQGSVHSGACEPELGDQVTVVAGKVTTGIDFVVSSWIIFSDGFESGDTSAW